MCYKLNDIMMLGRQKYFLCILQDRVSSGEDVNKLDVIMHVQIFEGMFYFSLNKNIIKLLFVSKTSMV